MNLRRTLPLVGCLLALAPCASRAAVNITLNSTAAFANDQSGGTVLTPFNGTTIPTTTPFDAIDGDSFSKNVADWSILGGQTILSFDLNHMRNGSKNTGGGFQARTFVSTIRFGVSEDTTYDLSGFYNVTDVGASDSGAVYYSASLEDDTNDVFLYSGVYESRSTHDEQFALGGAQGDIGHGETGSLTGDLVSGNTYVLRFDSYISAIPDADSGASATGNVTLKIGSAVPEPAALAVWSLLGVIVACSGWFRFRVAA